MMKSFVSILKREDQAVYEYNSYVDAVDLLVEKRKWIEEIPTDCETKSEDIRKCNELISAHEKNAEEAKQNVDKVRKELRDYISMLLENE